VILVASNEDSKDYLYHYHHKIITQQRQKEHKNTTYQPTTSNTEMIDMAVISLNNNNRLLTKAAALAMAISFTAFPLIINGFTTTTTTSPAATFPSSSASSSSSPSCFRSLPRHNLRPWRPSRLGSHDSSRSALVENRTLHEADYDPSTSAAFADPSSAREMVDLLSRLETDDGRSEMESNSPWSDVVLDLDGRPLTEDFLLRHLNLPSSAASASAPLRCPAKDAFRGFMSHGCRLLLPATAATAATATATNNNNNTTAPRSAYYKSIHFRSLPHALEKSLTAPFKLQRDIRSHLVVADFLSSRAREKFERATNVRIPKCLHADVRPDDDRPLESKFGFLLEDLAPWEGWYQRWLLCEREECEAALEALARMHAFFWAGAAFWTKENDGEDGKELERAVWKSGSYVQPEAQNTDTVDQCQIVADEWIRKRTRFSQYLSSFDWYDDLGRRLQSVAAECGRLAHPFADIHHPHEDYSSSSTSSSTSSSLSEQHAKYRTFTHGDPKQANIFFRRHPESNEQHSLQVGLVDFQWAGFGLAATDIAHFLTSAVHSDLLVDDGEERLLRYYHDRLQIHLVQYGAYDDASTALEQYPYPIFVEQYEIGVLDICRLMIAYTWSRFEEPVEKGDDDDEARARTMNKTSYNKSVCTFVWLLSKCDAIMKARGV